MYKVGWAVSIELLLSYIKNIYDHCQSYMFSSWTLFFFFTNTPQGETKGITSEHLPTIAVVGHYDSFGMVPGLATGGGDGAVVVLELARMFAKLYKKKKGNYHLLFLLTGTGHMNYAGTRHWLEQLDIQLMDSIDFVICLDDLDYISSGVADADADADAGAQLYLHYSKNPTNSLMKSLLNSFAASSTSSTTSSTSSSTITLHQQRKKIQLQNPHLAWQHEQFALKRIVGVTLSSRSTPTTLFGRRSNHFSSKKNSIHLNNVVRILFCFCFCFLFFVLHEADYYRW